MPPDSASQPSFRLSLWRPFRPASPLMARGQNGELHPTAELLQQVYAWTPGSVEMLSTFEGSGAESVRSRLYERFAPHQPIAQRGVRDFQGVVSDLLRELYSGQLVSHWTYTDQLVEHSDGDAYPVHCQCALAVLSHLEWIGRIFADVPECTVVIR